jgi:hypothetical protein
VDEEDTDVASDHESTVVEGTEVDLERNQTGDGNGEEGKASVGTDSTNSGHCPTLPPQTCLLILFPSLYHHGQPSSLLEFGGRIAHLGSRSPLLGSFSQPSDSVHLLSSRDASLMDHDL